MKTISTLLLAVGTILISKSSFSQCNSTAGGNGQAQAAQSAVTIDGDKSDWSVYLNDPDNNTYDNVSDMDAPFTHPSADIVRFTHTQDISNFYFLLERSASYSNTVDILFYADVNNNDLMEPYEPVIHLIWDGSNGNISVNVLNYFPSIGPYSNVLSQTLDGAPLAGTVAHRVHIGQTGKASADGKTVEIRVPFSFLKKLDSYGNTVHQLYAGQNFKFHISTVDGSLSDVPNNLDDNLGGCISIPMLSTLPVSLASFTATLNNNDKADLKWTTLTEINVSHFVIEKSLNGTDFSDAGMVFANGNSTEKTNYSFSDNLAGTDARVIYYRLRTADIDNKMQFSGTRMIKIGKTAENSLVIAAFPNPVTTALHITIPATWQNKKVVYEIFNVNGSTAARTEVSYSNQTETMDVKRLLPGLYLVRANCEGQSLQQKIIKQ